MRFCHQSPLLGNFLLLFLCHVEGPPLQVEPCLSPSTDFIWHRWPRPKCSGAACWWPWWQSSPLAQAPQPAFPLSSPSFLLSWLFFNLFFSPSILFFPFSFLLNFLHVTAALREVCHGADTQASAHGGCCATSMAGGCCQEVLWPSEEDQGNYNAVGLTLIPGKAVEQLALENISRHMKDKKAIRCSQHGFAKGKSCLVNLINFCDEMTTW